VILLEDLHETGDGPERRTKVMRHRIAERLELAVGRRELGGALLDAALEIFRARSTFSAITLNESASRPISS
jgi:hypothetical protein